MKLTKILFILSLALSSSAYSEILKEIKISGNKNISNQTIIVYGEIEKDKNYEEKDINQIVQKLYATDLFENIDLNFQNNILSIKVIEFKNISKLTISGEKSNRFIEQIKKIIKLKERRSYIKSYVSSDIKTLQTFYSSLGYNSALIDIKVKELDVNNVDLVIDISRGDKTKISSIKFIGDKKIKNKRLRDVIASEEDKFWKFLTKNTNFSQNLIDLDTRLLENYYKSIGYREVKVTSKTANFNDQNNIDLIYSIDAGKRYRFTKIETNLDSTFDKKIFSSLNKAYKETIGEYYSPFSIKKLLEELDQIIENNNMQFIEHNVEESIDPISNGIAVQINVFEGKKILVERINITGNSITNESVIRGELLLDEGDPFTSLGLQKSIAEIKSRNIFRNVETSVKEGSAENLKIINIDVEEKPTGEISAGAGIGTDGGSFAFNISENNWLGEGKRVNFELEVDAEEISGTFNYTDPNYDFLGNSINYYFGSSSNDKPEQGYENSIFSAGANTSFEQYKDIFLSLGLNYSYDDLRTDDSASASLKKQSGEFSEVSTTYGLLYDQRNRAFMPTDGSILRFNQTIPLYADRPFIANNFSGSKYTQFSEDIIGVAKIYLSSINGLNNKDIRLSKRQFLSSSRLRGFKKNRVGPKDGTDHVGGNYAAALNFETNLPNFFPDETKTDIGLFLDIANLWAVDYDSSIEDSNEIRSSTGVALNWSSPLGPMSFVLSTNLKKADTDETEGFKFNLGTTF
jgi:outer membrane protein insertion porin family